MKNKLSFILFLFFYGFNLYTLAQNAGYFTLRGNKFYDTNGNEFYPLILNYSCELHYDANITNPTLSDFYICPVAGYGSTFAYECTTAYDCLKNKIHNDFVNIHQMGFNAIRINGVYFKKSDDGLVGGFAEYGWDDINQQVKKLPILPPYSAGAAQKMFELLGTVVDEAETCSLAVILDETDNGILGEKTTNWSMYINDYAEYIKEKAKYFKDYKNIIGYSYIEEPSGDHSTKKEICDYSTIIYNASKSNDPNHLITYGGGLQDALSWDPSVVKVDFYSPHPYPDWADTDNPTYDVVNLDKRVKGMLHYFNQTSPLPWIIGEIGFSAIDDDYPLTNTPPHVYGDLTQQATFVENSLNWTRDCGASGYSYWNYQENRWGSALQDGFGLLRHEDDLNSPTIDKPAVSKFMNYLNNNQAPNPAPNSCDEPDNYRDRDNLEILHSNTPNIITGHVKNIANGIAIENALIYYWVEYQNENTITPSSPFKFLIYRVTFSESDGSFRLNPFHLHTDLTSNNIVKVTRISCIGCDVYTEGDFYISASITSGDKGILKNPYLSSTTLSGYTVAASQTNDFNSYLSLTVNDITINSNGNSNLTARNEINVNSEFIAENGSEVHIYTEDNCIIFNNYHPNRLASEKSDPKNKATLELNFKILPEVISVFPNPTFDKITIKNNLGGSSDNQFKLIDARGQIILSGLLTNMETNINLSSFPKGIYLLFLMHESKFISKKIILQ